MKKNTHSPSCTENHHTSPFTATRDDVLALKKGQLWNLQGQYLQVTDLGKRFVHYRMLRTPAQRTAPGLIAHRKHVLKFLSKRHALLLKIDM